MMFFNTALSESESAVHAKAKNPSSLKVSHGVDTQTSREQGIVIHCIHSYLYIQKSRAAAVEQVVIDHSSYYYA